MSERRKCKHCQQLFCPRPQNPDQHYCSERECQRARKRIWQKNKLLSDPDYRTNQSAAQSCWQKKNPDYWSNYRAKNPDYNMEDNRQRQQERNRRRRVQEIDQMAIAKMDASIPGRGRGINERKTSTTPRAPLRQASEWWQALRSNKTSSLPGREQDLTKAMQTTSNEGKTSLSVNGGMSSANPDLIISY
jgi:hypothetical protein